MTTTTMTILSRINEKNYDNINLLLFIMVYRDGDDDDISDI